MFFISRSAQRRILALIIGVAVGTGALLASGPIGAAFSTIGQVPGTVSGPTGSGPVHLLDVQTLARIVASDRSGIVSAYILPAEGTLGRALVKACERGAHYSIVLDGRSRVRNQNEAAIATYHGAGCEANFAHSPLHLKTVYLDRAVYLSDTNFSQDGYVLTTSVPSDRTYIAAALRDEPNANERFSTYKLGSLRLEAELIRRATKGLWVQTESFGPNNPVAEALAARIGSLPIRLIVADREYRETPAEQDFLRSLAARGVQVRRSPDRGFGANEKMAITESFVWTGSTNASPGVMNQIDWGMRIDDPTIQNSLKDRFARTWNESAPI